MPVEWVKHGITAGRIGVERSETAGRSPVEQSRTQYNGGDLVKGSLLDSASQCRGAEH